MAIAPFGLRTQRNSRHSSVRKIHVEGRRLLCAAAKNSSRRLREEFCFVSDCIHAIVYGVAVPVAGGEAVAFKVGSSVGAVNVIPNRRAISMVYWSWY